MSLVFYFSFAFYFVKMQLCVAKKRLCSGFYTSTPNRTPFLQKIWRFMVIYGFCPFGKRPENTGKSELWRVTSDPQVLSRP